MAVTTVCGIDPSSKKVAVVESSRNMRKEPLVHVLEFESEDIEHKVLEAYEFVFNLIMEIRDRDDESPAIFLEAPVVGIGGPGATIPQAFISGAIMVAAAEALSVLKLVNNKAWKKRTLGNGNIAKKDIQERMIEVWPQLYDMTPVMEKGEWKGCKDPDIIDAGGINLFGWRSVKMVERLKSRRKANNAN